MKRLPPSSRRQHGLSLLELLLGLAITAVIMAPLLPMLDNAHAAARISAERQDLERSASFALQRIGARVRTSAPSSLLASLPRVDWFKSVSFLLLRCDASGACVTVDSCDPGTAACRLVEREKGVDRVLAESVTAFSIETPAVIAGQPLVEISLALARGQASTSASATVRMGSIE